MGGRYDVWLENLIMPEMAVRTSFNSPAGANKSPTKLEFCKRLTLDAMRNSRSAERFDMNLWSRLFGSSQTKNGGKSPDVISYHGVDYVLPDGFSCVIGQDSTQQVPVAMIGPKAEDKFDHCLIQLRCIDVSDRIADEDLIKYLLKYGSDSPERAHFGSWRGFQNQERRHEQAGKTQHLHLLLVWERRFLIVEYSAPVEWYDFYKTRLTEMLSSSKASSVAISGT